MTCRPMTHTNVDVSVVCRVQVLTVSTYYLFVIVFTGSSYRCRRGGEWSSSVQDPDW